MTTHSRQLVLTCEGEPTTERVDRETFDQLLAVLGKSSLPIPGGLLVKHVMAVTAEFDRVVQLAALDELLKRLSNAKRDRVKLHCRPPDKKILGYYSVAKVDHAGDPYTVLLRGLTPLAASCNCPDFSKNSLGFCKHVLSVLGVLFSVPATRASAEVLLTPAHSESEATFDGPSLRWNPIWSHQGETDLLQRISWSAGRSASATEVPFVIKNFFSRGVGSEFRIKDTFENNPARRLFLLEALQKLSAADDHNCISDPALQEVLKVEIVRAQTSTRILPCTKNLDRWLKDFKQKLFPYQRAGVERFCRSGRLLLADDMGLGKTMQAIACCHALWMSKTIKRGLLIVPAPLKPQWLREWQKASGVPIEVLEGRAEERIKRLQATRAGIFIINYEQVLKDLSALQNWKPDLIVLDEAQRIKNWASKTSLFVKQLDAPFRLVLTGTPMENRLEELASIIGWVDSFALQPFWRISAWHLQRVEGKREVIGLKEVNLLRRTIQHCSLRRVRSEVLDQLPKRTDTRVPIAVTEAQREAHDELDVPIASLARVAGKRPLNQPEFLRLMQYLMMQRIISNGLEQLRFRESWPNLSKTEAPDEIVLSSLNSPKLLEFRRLIEELVIGQQRKVVVFSQWRNMLLLAHWAVAGLLNQNGLQAVFFSGQEGQKRRTQNMLDFLEQPAVRIFFSTDAGGVGLNLQQAAHCCINLELPWNPAVLEQRIGRVYRLGQKKPVDVYNLVSEYGIESRIASIVENKQALFSGLFDGTSDEINFERGASFLTQLQALVPSNLIASPQKASSLSENDEETSFRYGDDLIAELDQGAMAAAQEMKVPEPKTEEQQSRLISSGNNWSALFSQLSVQVDASGAMSIQAPADAARQLAEVFERLAGLLRKS